MLGEIIIDTDVDHGIVVDAQVFLQNVAREFPVFLQQIECFERCFHRVNDHRALLGHTLLRTMKVFCGKGTPLSARSSSERMPCLTATLANGSLKTVAWAVPEISAASRL